MIHVAAPMAALLFIFGLSMFWSSPELITADSGESWWAPWSWSLDETMALVNQAIAVAHANYTWTGLLLALTGAAGVAAMAVSSLSPKSKEATKSFDGISFQDKKASAAKAKAAAKKAATGKRGADPKMAAPKRADKYPTAV